MQEFIEIANTLADEAGHIVRQFYRMPIDVESKYDDSPVTVADRNIEKRLREIIAEKRPDDGIFGEEFGVKESKSGYTWVLDPIDGTKPFICGRPTFGTLIALCDERGAPILGIIDQAILKERWIGVKGENTRMNGEILATRQLKSLESAVCTSTTPEMFETCQHGFIQNWQEKVNFVSWGGDCTAYGALACGTIDLIIESLMKPYDYLALVPIIEGAGGYISDWDGTPLTLESGDTVIALGNPKLFKKAKKDILSLV